MVHSQTGSNRDFAEEVGDRDLPSTRVHFKLHRNACPASDLRGRSTVWSDTANIQGDVRTRVGETAPYGFLNGPNTNIKSLSLNKD